MAVTIHIHLLSYERFFFLLTSYVCKGTQDCKNEFGFYKAVFTCVNPGDGAGFGTEEGPVIGCGGLFISPSFVVPH